jgi:hypothetical protein
LIVVVALSSVAIAVYALTRPVGPGPLVVVAVVAGLVGFVAWSTVTEDRLRRRLAPQGAWGGAASPVGSPVRGTLVADAKGLTWAPKAGEPSVLGWDEIGGMTLNMLGQTGVRGFLRRFPPVPGARLDLVLRSGGAVAFWLSSSGARSLQEAASRIPGLRAALE